MGSLIKATVWSTCFAALIIAIAAQMDMPPGMVMPPGSVMPSAPTPNRSGHVVSPSVVLGLLAFMFSIFVFNQRA
ncbi:hypothetical protein ERO13_A03G142700v2 [Gossypium hirsutum]|uniref:Transmembrane protein n=3 Tax=Gossypium TaxID=3633 RepID=A0A5J5WFZ1_GOSBA|nr:hypothetical protein ES319_A03G155400v1 [Gossypium barbadense]KAG4208592.1 hypothetical protein ERO13_A03G142700v2 [Gossypium hirsutum]TYH25525.1 hypothetical protein ES288_A03G175800v1 [Gossypium darwinii]TYI36862.1 hypothetical protein ES332_A03G170900v1 [Gossypium tomentosum]